jgi:hypothetical protein
MTEINDDELRARSSALRKTMTEINNDELRARSSALRETMTEISDDELRARFSTLREQHRRVEPEFRAMLNRAARSSHTDRSGIRSTRWVAVAAVILIAAALIVGKAPDLRREPQATLAAQTITTWQSPTAGLLQPPARDLLAPPPLLSSVFDGVASPTLQLKTD